MNDHIQAASTADSNKTKFAQVPADFLRPMHIGAIGGVHPKALLVEYEGQFYSPGCTPPLTNRDTLLFGNVFLSD